MRSHRALLAGSLVVMTACWSGGIDESATIMTDAQLSAGLNCGATGGGDLRCWGEIPAALGTPGAVTTPVRVPARGTPRLVNARASYYYGGGCGLERDGTAWCWGNNGLGQLGNGTRGADRGLTQVDQPEPFSDIAPGGPHTCSLGRSGTVYCWGAAAYLGLPVTLAPDNCILGSGLLTDTIPCVTRPTPIDAPAQFEAIALGDEHSCALSVAAELWCWGSNWNGATGLGDTTDFVAQPAIVPGLSAVSSVSASTYATCASTSAGALWCWGYNTVIPGGSSSIPVEIGRPTGTAFRGVALANDHACALDQEGAAWCWGAGLGVGNATTGRVSEPVRVLGGLRFSMVRAGGGIYPWYQGTSCGVADDGTWCWGGNAGDGSGEPQSLPVRVAGQGSAD